jgi:ParB family chromosome partitioning protein
MKRKALGRGLSALIPTDDAPAAKARDDFFICPIEQVEPQPGQPRRYFDSDRLAELVQSIKEQGLVQPLIVRQIGKRRYQLIAGERRWRASQQAGLHDVPVVVRKADDLQAFELALVENLQREDLNPIEEAEAFQRLLEEHQYSQEQVAEKVGKDRSTVANSLRLLRLPEVAQRALIAGLVSAGHARALLALEKPRPISRALKQVLDGKLSVRQTESLVRKQLSDDSDATEKKKPPQASANVQDLQERLSRALGTRVTLTARGKKGKIEIHYSSLDQLDHLLEVLLP